MNLVQFTNSNPPFSKLEKKLKNPQIAQSKTPKIAATKYYTHFVSTHRRLVHIGRIVEEQAGNQRRNVGRIRGDEYHTEAAPHVDQEFVGPRFRRLERHQVAAQQAPHHPQSCDDMSHTACACRLVIYYALYK